MFRSRLATTTLLSLGLGLLVAAQMAPAYLTNPGVRTSTITAPTTTQRAALQADYGRLPISFEPNMGQAGAATVRFLARGTGYTLALSATGATLVLASARPAGSAHGALLGRHSIAAPVAVPPAALLTMRWSGANPLPQITGEDPLPGVVNYLIGNDSKQWHTNIPTYQQVRLHNVYAGVDLVYYGTSGRLEYDFVVAPGADPSRIALGFTGAEHVGVDLAGNLSLTLPGGALQQDKPLIYQTVNGVRKTVPGGYALGSHGRVGFTLGTYDRHHALIIDPLYRFSTYLGGNESDDASGIVLDSAGNAYLAGTTFSSNWPPPSPPPTGHGHIFVIKLNAAGTALLYTTLLGGSGTDTVAGPALDASNDVLLTGSTTSTNFPTVNALQSTNAGGFFGYDGFVSKLNATGSAFVYSTYLGGTNDDYGYGIGADSAGNAYVTGTTNSSDFPTHSAYQSTLTGTTAAFVTKINPSGSAFVYSTYLGGSTFNDGFAITADGSGNAYITGDTNSIDFPTMNPVQSSNAGGNEDAFVTKLNASGSAPVFSTYLGGTADDFGNAITMDGSGNVYVAGHTNSTDFPTHVPLQAASAGNVDIFVTKYNAAGSAYIYSTYLGGNQEDFPTAIAADSAGNAYVVGNTDSSNFPTANALEPTYAGVGEAFVTRIDPTGATLLYSSYLGSSGMAGTGSGAIGVAILVPGTVFVAGGTDVLTFPTKNALQSTPGGNGGGGANLDDVFVTKLLLRPTPLTTTGVFRPSNGNLYLKNSNTTGYADITLEYGQPGDLPITGDWTGKGYKSIGIYRNGTFYLRNSNTTGYADIVVPFGASGDIPVAGDWTGKGYDSIGYYQPSNSTFYLRDSNTSGPADHVARLGNSGDVPITGDWTGKGWDSIGVFRPSNGVIYLRNSNTTGVADISFVYGVAGDKPLVGDWTAKGYDSIGVDRNGNFLLRNSNTTGPADMTFYLGVSGDDPIAGPWLAPVGSVPSHLPAHGDTGGSPTHALWPTLRSSYA